MKNGLIAINLEKSICILAIQIIAGATQLRAESMDCQTLYRKTLEQYNIGIHAVNALVNICDKKGDDSSECRQAHSLIANFSVDPMLRELDRSCPNIYDSRFLPAVNAWGAARVEVIKRDNQNPVWRGCKDHKISRDVKGNVTDIKCIK